MCDWWTTGLQQADTPTRQEQQDTALWLDEENDY
jgi:hypothetical protein